MLDRGLSLCIQGTCALLNLRAPGPRFIPVHTGNIGICYYPQNYNPVYPCAYREHQVCIPQVGLISGLSLCIQGTLICAEVVTRSVRFIPVHTGNIAVISNQNNNNTVYPCAYREHRALPAALKTRSGLSLCIQGTCLGTQFEFYKGAVYPCAYREHISCIIPE